MKGLKILGQIILKIIMISLALLLFFSMMAGMYYNSAPKHIKVAVLDEDQSPLSRSIIFNIKQSPYLDVTQQAYDYLNLQKMVDQGEVEMGVVIPDNAYQNVLNKRPVNLLTVIDGTANPAVSKLSLMMINKIILTLDMQMMMKLRVEDLGGIPNVRHPKSPPLKVNERIFFNPKLSMEGPMLPAFMGLPMQIVSMLIILFAVFGGFNQMREKMPHITKARHLPLKALIPPFIISWIIVTSAINIAFFATMHLFDVPIAAAAQWRIVFIISMLVLAMESLAYFLVLNIRNGAVLAAIITLIVFPAYMYSGYLIPGNQMADLPNKIGSWFPLRHYMKAIYPVMHHNLPLSAVQGAMDQIYIYILIFIGLSILSILFGRWEEKRKRKHYAEKQQPKS